MIKREHYKRIAVIGAALAVMTAAGCVKEADEGERLPRSTVALRGETFTVELAYKRTTRARGLMYRESLEANAGMLFIFREPSEKSFYMKHCLIDLDLVYLGADRRVASLMKMKKPERGEELIYYPSGGAIQYALELPGGTIERLGVEEGDAVEFSEEILAIVPERD